jgi:hypothetical protein
MAVSGEGRDDGENLDGRDDGEKLDGRIYHPQRYKYLKVSLTSPILMATWGIEPWEVLCDMSYWVTTARKDGRRRWGAENGSC